LAAFALGPEAEAAGCRLLALDEAASTSALALDLARAGERGPLWVVAARQTAGHGRRGRAWHSAAGNLAASFLMMTDAAPAEVATLGFAAGHAVHQAVAAVAPALGETIGLKWPNDVLAHGAKLAGILVETEAQIVALGVGVNVAAAPAGLPYAATSLAELGARVSAEALFAALSDGWVPLLDRWREGGFAALRRDWLERAMGLGTPLAATRGGETIAGIFETIDSTGRLVLRGEGGALTAIAAGEVQFGDAATLTAGEAG
jgi:BirA family biotin operon repressor/biotin-[acetyl-CoA-carboxylase] ligase